MLCLWLNIKKKQRNNRQMDNHWAVIEYHWECFFQQVNTIFRIRFQSNGTEILNNTEKNAATPLWILTVYSILIIWMCVCEYDSIVIIFCFGEIVWFIIDFSLVFESLILIHFSLNETTKTMFIKVSFFMVHIRWKIHRHQKKI